MARQRTHAKDSRSNNSNIRHRKTSTTTRSVKQRSPYLENWNNKLAIFVAANVIIVILCVVYFFYQHHLENIIVTPLNLPKVVIKSGLDVPEKFWGSYRSGAYFGLQTRSENTLATGMMWFTQKVVSNRIEIRHWCNQWDNIKHYSWLEHDGENFGIQKIEDKDYFLVTSFVKQPGGDHGGDWTAKISVRHKEFNPSPVPVSLMFYAYATADARLTPFVVNEGHLRGIRGHMNELGNFTIQFREIETSKTILKYNYLSTYAPSIAHLKESVISHLAQFQAKERVQLQILGLNGEAIFRNKKGDKFTPNFIVYQVTFIPPFELEVYFESGSFTSRPSKFIGPLYNMELDNHMKRFEETFEYKFRLLDKLYNPEEIKTAWAALSNMIGGIGYFYGSSLVQSSHNKDPISYWKAPLYTAVPSRSFFPRGFLWDEGFHNLLILEWNPEISKDILSHWLDLINTEGWIPREQILGVEARERVPAEFVIQKNTNANPPTLFLTFERLLNKMKTGEIPEDIDFLKRAFPRLKVWFGWFNRTQAGMIPGTYRWRGRDSQTDAELNPKTLTSGLDDYPRATHPTIDERHIDLRCWIAFAAGVLADIGDFIDEPVEKYRNTHQFLTDNKLLDLLHWSLKTESYCDYGFHSRSVKLVQEKVPFSPGSHETQTITYREVKEEPALRFVNNFGYVSLFPFLLKIIDADNPKLIKVMADIKNPNLLWTDYGLRSLSKSSPYYLKYNTEHDPPYWRGSIWININFLAIRAFHHYSVVDGPYKKEARSVYTELRDNVVKNIIDEYKRTGFIWEQYDDRTGEGKGVHPFTGWSALLVLLMAEIF
ncbi:mannosyl-oligosaccharide glucosidase [Parasteatoda tepidariorum]|uniref:mannosyl-oligosaccharide glucosidase n=1 Tax=Parasteatoda tepidariorum TaxID=114398 RepID=UPI00077FE387|nr:mannosyl-oligosaccharide glucosidase [Parasteatoda tepidariorum]XP_042897296.1 mannosyl-oligosaccharide glucosidase [Parasteatoda tepidariorum]